MEAATSKSRVVTFSTNRQRSKDIYKIENQEERHGLLLVSGAAGVCGAETLPIEAKCRVRGEAATPASDWNCLTSVDVSQAEFVAFFLSNGWNSTTLDLDLFRFGFLIFRVGSGSSSNGIAFVKSCVSDVTHIFR